MNVIVCGDRHWGALAGDEQLLIDRLARLPIDTRLVHGGAKGADLMAASVAARLNALGHRFLIEEMRAEWATYGKAAGPMRNQRMLRTDPALVIAFHHDLTQSKGTANMVALAHKARVAVEVIG